MPKSNGTPNGEVDVFDVFATSELTTVYLDPGRKLWVRLLNELDYGQASELDAASIRGVTLQAATDAMEQGQLMVFDLGHQRRLKLSLYIDDWSLPMPWPAKLDERYQLVKRLKPRIAAAMLAEIERLEADANEAAVAVADPPDTGPNLRSLPSQAAESEAKSS